MSDVVNEAWQIEVAWGRLVQVERKSALDWVSAWKGMEIVEVRGRGTNRETSLGTG